MGGGTQEVVRGHGPPGPPRNDSTADENNVANENTALQSTKDKKRRQALAKQSHIFIILFSLIEIWRYVMTLTQIDQTKKFCS